MMGWLIRTVFDLLNRAGRKSIARMCRDEGYILSPDIGGAIVVATPSEFVEKAGEAWKDVGHDGAKIPMNEPWERR